MGRIIIGWESEDIQIDILHCDSQFIHVTETPMTGTSFHCTFVYGSSMVHERKKLFTSLQEISNSIQTPWVVLGDFNCVENFNERYDQPIRLHEIKPFRDCLEWCGLHDIYYTGRFFTWTNKLVGQRRVISKIDRVLGNDR